MHSINLRVGTMFMDFLCITIENLALSLFSCFRKKKHVGLDLHHEAHGFS